MKFTLVVVVCVATYLFFACRVTVEHNQRVIVLNLAKYERILPEGKHYIKPFIESVVLVNVKEHVIDWALLSEKEITQKIEALYLAEPEKFKPK